MAKTRFEVPFTGIVTTLSGQVLRNVRRLVYEKELFTVVNTASVTLLSPNPRRIWSLIHVNGDGDGDDCVVRMGPSSGYYDVHLRPGGHLLFNREMPYIGLADCYAVSSTTTVFVIECFAED